MSDIAEYEKTSSKCLTFYKPMDIMNLQSSYSLTDVDRKSAGCRFAAGKRWGSPAESPHNKQMRPRVCIR